MIVYQKALELVRLVHELLRVLRPLDPETAEQLDRAVRSVPLNIAEGRSGRGKNRGRHFNIALCSSREVSSCLDISVALELLRPEAVKPALALADEIQAMLFVLSR